MRITKKYIIKWLNDKFKELGEPLVATEVTIYTGLSQSAIESGCCRLAVHISVPNGVCYIYCRYSMGDLQRYVDMGYKLIWRLGEFGIINNSEIDLVKA